MAINSNDLALFCYEKQLKIFLLRYSAFTHARLTTKYWKESLYKSIFLLSSSRNI